MNFCPDCAQVSSGDCGKHGPRVVRVPTQTYGPQQTICERCEKLEEALRLLKNSECWCGVGIGNPMYGGRHSNACLKIQELMK